MGDDVDNVVIACGSVDDMDDIELSDGVSVDVGSDHTVPETPQAGIEASVPTTPARAPPPHHAARRLHKQVGGILARQREMDKSLGLPT